MYSFEFVKAKTVAEAVKALKREDAQALGGGQTLIPTLRSRLASPSALVSLNGIAEMIGVCVTDDGMLAIGGATPHAVVAKEAKKHYPALAALAGNIGDPAVRSRGTIGGSLANNDPAACYPSAVLASGATVVTNKRKIAADKFYQLPNKPGVFAAGDILRPHLLTTVIGQGSIAADSIDHYRKKQDMAKRPKVDVHHFNLLAKLQETSLS